MSVDLIARVGARGVARGVGTVAVALAVVVASWAGAATAGAEPAASGHAAQADLSERPAVGAEVWGACGWRTKDSKVVRTFARQRGDAGMGFVLRGGTSKLLCGDEGFSYRHILKHRGEWETDARIGGTNWRDHADWSIATVLGDPDVVTYRAKNDAYCYSRSIELWDKGNRRHVDTKIVKVALRASDAAIITAFPTREQCP